MENKLKLMLYNAAAGGQMTAQEYIEGQTNGQIAWPADLNDCSFALEQGGTTYIADEWNLGDVVLLASQIEDALSRLRNNQPALMRSAVTDGLGVPFILFEPQGNQILISVFGFPDDLEDYFPAGPAAKPEGVQKLYEAYPSVRDEFFELIGGIQDEEYFRELAFAKEDILQDLITVQQQAETLAALPGIISPESYY